jgi:hypothetical protein
MATINGVTFNLVNLRVLSVHRNIMTDQPGSDTNFITDMGYDGLVLRIEGYETTLASYDNVIAAFMASGERTLVFRSGWQYSVNSVQYTPDLLEGFADNYFPYEMVVSTSTPYRESTTLDGRAYEITSNNETWSAENAATDNLLKNWSMEDWNAGTTTNPDHWLSTRMAASFPARSSTYKHGTYSANIRWDGITGTNCGIYQSISDYIEYRGKTISIGAYVKAPGIGDMNILIGDGVDTSESSTNTTTDWEWLSTSLTIDENATYVRIVVYTTDDSGNSLVDGAVLIEGDSIPDSTFARDIDTDGNVDALPNIKIKSNETAYAIISQTDGLS